MPPLCEKIIPQKDASEVDNENTDSGSESLPSNDDSSLRITTFSCFERHFYIDDHNIIQLLERTTGKTNLEEINELKLKTISEEISLSRVSLLLPQLTCLNLDGSCISSLRELGCNLQNLQILRISYSGIVSLDGILGLTALRELYASYNNIEDVGMCASLSYLKVLDLRRNNVSSMQGIEFLSTSSTLRCLTLAENPLALEHNYREQVIKLLPKLRLLDGIKCKNYLSPCSSKSSDSESSQSEYELVITQRSAFTNTHLMKKISPEKNYHETPVGKAAMQALNSSTNPASTLTSGTILCGNIAKSLRNKRRGIKTNSTAESSSKDENMDAVEASKRWRYQSARMRLQTP